MSNTCMHEACTSTLHHYTYELNYVTVLIKKEGYLYGQHFISLLKLIVVNAILVAVVTVGSVTAL